jgi:hypothetical protein
MIPLTAALAGITASGAQVLVSPPIDQRLDLSSGQ